MHLTGKTDSRNLLWLDFALGCGFANRDFRRAPPVVWVLFGPTNLQRNERLMLFRRRGEDDAGLIDKNGARSAGTNVDAENICLHKLFPPLAHDVQTDCRDQNSALNNVLDKIRHILQGHAIVQADHEECAEACSKHRSSSTRQTRPTDHASRNGVQFEQDAGVWSGAAHARGIDDGRNRSQKAENAECREHLGAKVDPGKPRGLRVAADSIKVASKQRVLGYEGARQGHDNKNEDWNRNTGIRVQGQHKPDSQRGGNNDAEENSRETPFFQSMPLTHGVAMDYGPNHRGHGNYQQDYSCGAAQVRLPQVAER